MGRNRLTAPAALCETWPDVKCTDPDAEAVRLLAVNLRAAMGERSIRSIAQAAGIDHGIVARLLAGQAWPEVATVARLERGLGARLWPEHVEGVVVHTPSSARSD